MDNNAHTLKRLIALWAFSESALGGLLHLFRFPFSGLLLAGFAILIICIIAHYADQPSKEILKSLFIVAAIKLAISPHSPITAYLALFFQGILGAMIFHWVKPNGISILIFALLAYLETAFQKIFVLTILFGKNIWMSIDAFGEQIISYFPFLSFLENQWSLSIVAVTLYTSIYLSAALILSYFTKDFLHNIEKSREQVVGTSLNNINLPARTRSKNRRLKMIFLLGVPILLMLLFIPKSQFFHVLIRSIIIIGVWFFVLAPVIQYFLKRIVNEKTKPFKKYIDEIISLFPFMKKIVIYAWEESAKYKNVKRLYEFLQLVIVLSLELKID